MINLQEIRSSCIVFGCVRKSDSTPIDGAMEQEHPETLSGFATFVYMNRVLFTRSQVERIFPSLKMVPLISLLLVPYGR